MNEDIVVRVTFRYVLLLIQVYAFYIILHGHLSPGGGFAGGVVLGLSMVLYFFAFGVSRDAQMLHLHIAIFLIGIGGAFEGIKFFLPKEVVPAAEGELFLGLLSVMSFAIGMLVASAILVFFYLLMGD